MNETYRKILGQEPPEGFNILRDGLPEQLGLAAEARRAFEGEELDLAPVWLSPQLLGRSEDHDGRGLALATRSIPLRDHTGELAYVAFVLRDVTAELLAREEAEARRRQEEQDRARLEAVIRHLPGGTVLAHAPSGRIFMGNAQLERILGHPVIESEDVSEYRRYGAIHPDGTRYDVGEHPLTRALRGELVEAQQVLYRRPDGQVRVLEVDAAPVRDAEGNVHTAVATLFDVTERRWAEEGLALLAEAGSVLVGTLEPEQTARNAARLAVPRLADVCVLYLREGDVLRRVEVAHTDPAQTERFARLWDLYPVDMDAAHPAVQVARSGEPMLIDPVTPEMLRRAALDEAHLAALQQLETRSAYVVPLRGRSSVLGALGFLMLDSGRQFDPVLRRTAEDLADRVGLALENAALYRRAQEAIRTREEVLAVVSHDLRNPLSVVQLNSNLLVHRAARPPEDRRLERSALAIQNAALRMRRLIDDLLDLANIDAGKLAIEPRPERIDDLLEEVLASHGEAAANAGRVLETGEAPQLEVLCDRGRILQVLGNLVDNALKHSPERGTVRVEARPAEAEVIFSVSDEGPGIAPADQAHLFERFWQKDPSRPGAGLGLSIARALVEAHGGRLWLESAPGRGSTFSFSLPSASAA